MLEMSLENQEYEFKVKRLVVQRLVDKGLIIEANRLKRQQHGDLEDYDAQLIRHILDIATQEDPLYKHPTRQNSRGMWWEYLKARWFPDWLLRKFPIKYEEIIAVHKFPELSLPDSLLGREFVHLKIVELEDLGKKRQ